MFNFKELKWMQIVHSQIVQIAWIHQSIVNIWPYFGKLVLNELILLPSGQLKGRKSTKNSRAEKWLKGNTIIDRGERVVKTSLGTYKYSPFKIQTLTNQTNGFYVLLERPIIFKQT